MGKCSPQNKPPVNYADRLENIIGIDRNNDEAFLRKKAGILFGPSGDVACAWADGSDERPIVLDEMKEQQTPSKGVLVKGHDGRIYAITPKDDGRFVLTADGGSVFFEDEATNKTTFNREDVEAFSGCDFNFAVFEGCSPDGSFRLRKISRDSLCEALDSSNGAASLIGCNNGGMRSIVPSSSGKMLVGSTSGWSEEDVDMRFRYNPIPLYEPSSTAFVSLNWSDLGKPSPRSSGRILAFITFNVITAGVAGGQVQCFVNGSAIIVVYDGPDSGGAQQQYTMLPFDITDHSQITLQKIVQGSPSTSLMAVNLVGFCY